MSTEHYWCLIPPSKGAHLIHVDFTGGDPAPQVWVTGCGREVSGPLPAPSALTPRCGQCTRRTDNDTRRTP